MTITVKRWIGDQKYDEMKAYNRAPEFVYTETEQGEYYADTENDTITMVVLKVLKESAKAVQVELETKDFNTGDFVKGADYGKSRNYQKIRRAAEDPQNGRSGIC